MAVEKHITKEAVATPTARQLARKLAVLEGELSRLRRTRNAMMSARLLAERALHYGFAARGDNCDFSAIYQDGFDVLAHLSERACSEVIDANSAFIDAVKADAFVGRALQSIHAETPLGEVWTGEPYPDPQ